MGTQGQRLAQGLCQVTAGPSLVPSEHPQSGVRVAAWRPTSPSPLRQAPDTQRPRLSQEPAVEGRPRNAPWGEVCGEGRVLGEAGQSTDGRAPGHPWQGGQDAALQDRGGEADPAAEVGRAAGQRASEPTCEPASQPEGGSGGLGVWDWSCYISLAARGWGASLSSSCGCWKGLSIPETCTGSELRGNNALCKTHCARAAGPPPQTGGSLPEVPLGSSRTEQFGDSSWGPGWLFRATSSFSSPGHLVAVTSARSPLTLSTEAKPP